MLLLGEKGYCKRIGAGGTDLDVSTSDIMPFGFLVIIQPCTKLHQLPNQSSVSLLQIDPNHGCGYHRPQEIIFIY